MIKDQITKDNYTLINSDCMYVLPQLPKDSIDLSVYSPPFCGLYQYSSSTNDFSNCESREQFLEQYEFLISEIGRITKPGRMTVVHCQHIPEKGNKIWNFPKHILELHEKHGFEFFDERYIWKEPLKVAIRTRAQGLQHKWIVQDSTKCRSALADILMIFRKKGENKVPVTHEKGFRYYSGSTPMPQYFVDKYKMDWPTVVKKYQHTKNPRENKMSHIIWQRYASVFWDDIRLSNSEIDTESILPRLTKQAVLDFKESKEEDDEKHVHPLQLDVIDRIVDLYSNPLETILTPFMGVGSEVYSPVSMGRKAIGIELKESYYRQSIKNLKTVQMRFEDEKQLSLI